MLPPLDDKSLAGVIASVVVLRNAPTVKAVLGRACQVNSMLAFCVCRSARLMESLSVVAVMAPQIWDNSLFLTISQLTDAEKDCVSCTELSTRSLVPEKVAPKDDETRPPKVRFNAPPRVFVTRSLVVLV